jgi:hypothetical protein
MGEGTGVFQDAALQRPAFLVGLAKANLNCEICASGTFFGSKELHSRVLYFLGFYF